MSSGIAGHDYQTLQCHPYKVTSVTDLHLEVQVLLALVIFSLSVTADTIPGHINV